MKFIKFIMRPFDEFDDYRDIDIRINKELQKMKIKVKGMENLKMRHQERRNKNTRSRSSIFPGNK
jgi:hypothetical protein